MKKVLLLTFVLFLSLMTFAARLDLPLSGIGSGGWGSGWTSDGNGTITFATAWEGAGWGFWGPPLDASAYKKLVFNFEAVPSSVNLMVEYNNVTDGSGASLSQGQTSGEIVLNPNGASSIKQIWIQPSSAGTIVLKEAYFTDGATEVTPSTVLDFESDDLGKTYSFVGWGASDGKCVVEANPTGSSAQGAKSLHVTSTNWNYYPKFSVTLPAGKTVADIDKFSFDVYLGTNGSADQNSYKHIDYFIGAPGTSFTANVYTGSSGNVITTDPTNTWLSKEFVPTIPAAVSSLNQFDLGFGVSVQYADYYFDNLKLVLKGGSGIIQIKPMISNVCNTDGGIIVNGNNENVNIYAIDGRLVKQAVANKGTNIPLQKGLYIVKVGANNAVKVLVK